MSATMIRLEFSAVVDKPENLPAEIIAEADAAGGTADDIVRDRLYDVMARAGQRYIDAHPELFRHGTGLV